MNRQLRSLPPEIEGVMLRPGRARDADAIQRAVSSGKRERVVEAVTRSLQRDMKPLFDAVALAKRGVPSSWSVDSLGRSYTCVKYRDSYMCVSTTGTMLTVSLAPFVGARDVSRHKPLVALRRRDDGWEEVPTRVPASSITLQARQYAMAAVRLT